MKRWFLILTGLLLGSLLQASGLPRNVTIGIVTDGPSPAYDLLEQRLMDELGTLVQGEFLLHVRNDRRLDGNWSVTGVERSLERLENEDDVDIVLALGIVSGAVAASRARLAKPTFAPILIQIDNSAPAGNGSGIMNLNYLDAGATFDGALQQYRRSVPFSRLTLVADAAHLALLKASGTMLAQRAAARGVALTIVTDDGSGTSLLDRIPSGTEAVMLTPLPRLSEMARRSLLEGLKTRRLPSYTFDDRASVEAGALMGARSADDTARRSRRMALNILAVLRGAKAEMQPVRFELKSPLTINMETARAIGFSPSFALMRDAVLVHDRPSDPAQRLSLAEAAREAVRTNLSVVAGALGIDADSARLDEVRSVLFPRLHAGVGYSRFNSDNVFVENGFYAEKSTSGAIRLEQLLFSERTLAQLEVSRSRHSALEAQQRSLELDIVKRTAAAFLGILSAQEHLEILEAQLTLVRSNYELARGRVETGVSDRSDLYHWESMIASERQKVLAAEANLRKARELLSVILHRDIDARYVVEPAMPEDPGLLVSRKELRDLVSDETAYGKMTEFFVAEGLSRAPELAALRAQIAAESRLLRSRKRAYWSPEVAAYGEVTHIFDETRAPGSTFSLEDETNWEAGIALSLPLYEGGARSARSMQSQLRLRELQTRYRESGEELTRRIRSDLHALRASYPAIALSRRSEEAARRSFELIRENYAAGSRPITDLLVAQSTLLGARQAAADARYRFLNDLMALQRDSGRFNFFLNDEEKEALIRRLRRHMGAVTDSSTKEKGQ